MLCNARAISFPRKWPGERLGGALAVGVLAMLAGCSGGGSASAPAVAGDSTAEIPGPGGPPPPRTERLLTPPGVTARAPAVEASEDGSSWMLGWIAADGGASGVFGRALSADLTARSAAVRLDESGTARPEVALAWAEAAGQWLFAWTGLDGSGTGVKARFVAER